MSIKKNVPTVATSLGKPCPVCGRTSYSLGGTHPQCSFLAADQKLLLRRKRKLR
jgi:hypothetical protein